MKEYLTTKEVMELFKINKNQIKKFREKGMPCMVLSERTIRYDKEKIEKWFLSKTKVG